MSIAKLGRDLVPGVIEGFRLCDQDKSGQCL